MRGGVPVMLKQPRCGVDQERHEHPVGLGDVECPLEGTFRARLVADLVARDRLKQVSPNHPYGVDPDGPVKDGRERGRHA